MTGQEIRRIRLDFELSQAKFADKIGMSSCNLSLLENGRHKISKVFQKKIERLKKKKETEQMGKIGGEHAWHTVNAAIASLESGENSMALVLLKTLRHFLADSKGHEVPE